MPEDFKKFVSIVYSLSPAFTVAVVCRLFADELAEQGFLVFLPDMFEGKRCRNVGDSLLEFEAWMHMNPYGPQVLQLQEVLDHVQQKYMPRSVSVIGFCWGGHHSVLLAQSDRVSAAVVAHGACITQDMVQAVKQPLLFLFCHKNSCGSDEVNGNI